MHELTEDTVEDERGIYDRGYKEEKEREK